VVQLLAALAAARDLVALPRPAELRARLAQRRNQLLELRVAEVEEGEALAA
jgi:chemotaxis response regulator CheB